MDVQIGDEIMIMPQKSDQPVREGEIRGIRNDPGGVVYLVQWLDTGQESMVEAGPDVVIKHRRGPGSEANATGATRWLSRLRHPLEWQHSRAMERMHEEHDQLLAWRMQDILAGLGLDQTDFSIAGGRTVHVPEVVWVEPGPPKGLNVRMLPGQTPEDFSAHAPAIAYDLDVAEVRVVPLGYPLVRLELLPHDWPHGPSASEPVTTSR
jgi:hypothetical protein